MHGYRLAARIRRLSDDVLRVEETLRANRKFGLARKLLERASRTEGGWHRGASDAPSEVSQLRLYLEWSCNYSNLG